MSWSSYGMESIAIDTTARAKIDELKNEINKLKKEFALLSKMSAQHLMSDAELLKMIDFVPDEEMSEALSLMKVVDRNLDVKIAAASGRKDELMKKFITEQQADLLIKAYRK